MVVGEEACDSSHEHATAERYGMENYVYGSVKEGEMRNAVRKLNVDEFPNNSGSRTKSLCDDRHTWEYDVRKGIKNVDIACVRLLCND